MAQNGTLAEILLAAAIPAESHCARMEPEIWRGLGMMRNRGGSKLLVCVAAASLVAQPLPAQEIDANRDGGAASAPTAPRVVISVSRAADIGTAGGRMIEVQPSRPVPVASGSRAAEQTLAGLVPTAMPLFGSWITSRYGRRLNPLTGMWGNHRGVDLAAPHGTPVVATADGVVARAGWLGSYGIIVVLRHGAGIETRYAHLSAVAVTPGKTVKQGQVIGFVGSTGRSTGPHLHYEIRRGDRAIDPETAWRR